MNTSIISMPYKLVTFASFICAYFLCISVLVTPPASLKFKVGARFCYYSPQFKNVSVTSFKVENQQEPAAPCLTWNSAAGCIVPTARSWVAILQADLQDVPRPWGQTPHFNGIPTAQTAESGKPVKSFEKLNAFGADLEE